MANASVSRECCSNDGRIITCLMTPREWEFGPGQHLLECQSHLESIAVYITKSHLRAEQHDTRVGVGMGFERTSSSKIWRRLRVQYRARGHPCRGLVPLLQPVTCLIEGSSEKVSHCTVSITLTWSHRGSKDDDSLSSGGSAPPELRESWISYHYGPPNKRR